MTAEGSSTLSLYLCIRWISISCSHLSAEYQSSFLSPSDFTIKIVCTFLISTMYAIQVCPANLILLDIFILKYRIWWRLNLWNISLCSTHHPPGTSPLTAVSIFLTTVWPDTVCPCVCSSLDVRHQIFPHYKSCTWTIIHLYISRNFHIYYLFQWADTIICKLNYEIIIFNQYTSYVIN